MKSLKIAMMVLSAIAVLIAAGCSKENNPVSEKQEKAFQPSEKDLQIESKILNFKEKIEFAKANPGLKSGGEDLTLEDAVWNIEALTNYMYADASSNYENYMGDEVEITIVVTYGMVTITDAGSAYDEVVESLTEQYNQIPGENKQLMIADVSLKESDDQTATFVVTSGFGEGGFNPFAPFGETDYWWFGNYQGKCGPYYGQGDGSDAAEEIEKKINTRISLPTGHRYFTDINEIEIMGLNNEIIFEPNSQEPEICECCDLINPNDPIPNDNYFERLVFFNRSDHQNYHGCLYPDSPDEMNFYLDNMEDLIYSTLYECFEDQLDGKLFSRCNIEGLDWSPDPYYYFHRGYIYYGISVGSGDPPAEL